MGNQFQKNKRPISTQVKQVYKTYKNFLKVCPTNCKVNKIGLSQQVKVETLEDLFDSFKPLKYTWAQQMYPMFYKNFYEEFEDLWIVNRQQFYRHLLVQSRVLTTSCIEISETSDYDFQNCRSKQQYFYESGKDSGSISQKTIRHNLSSIGEINSCILKERDCLPQSVKLSFSQLTTEQGSSNQSQQYETDLFVEGSDSQIIRSLSSKTEYSEDYFQNSSVLIPETVFIDRLSEESKTQTDQFVSFYTAFSNSLQHMINNISLISCPLKHFQASMREKVQRKRIQKTQVRNSATLLALQCTQKKLKIRQHNNNVLLIELRDFNEAYSEFVWKFLNLDRMAETKMGTLITFDMVYNVVLKSVWKLMGWIGKRGYEWQEAKLPQIMPSLQMSNDLYIPEEIILKAQLLTKEHNPLKYLKQIVIIYRQISKFCPNADQLLNYYEKLFHCIISNKKHRGIFRMRNIIEKIIRLDHTNGQICYAWTTWSIVVEIFKRKVEETGREDPKQ